MPKTIRVYKAGSEWVAKRDGSSRGRYFSTQKGAYLYARDVALNNGLTVTVYYPNGGIKAVINPKDRNNENDNCFITTACVRYYNLPDNCYQLQTLRFFRDSYLKKQVGGNDIIRQYYSVAPILVKFLSCHPDKNILFEDIFHQINTACSLITKGENAKAKKLYVKVVLNLLKYFQLN
jgi:hypothetical protein